jgi:glycosyltransferase involved in cell wall biosynthesis
VSARKWPADGRHVVVVVQNMTVPLDRRVWLECQTLVAAGLRVSVVCPKGPGDPSHAELDGVRLHKYRPAPAPRGPLGYAVEFAWSWIRTAELVRRIHRRDPVAVLQACNPPDTYWLLALLMRRAGTRFVFDHHDLCPELYRSRGGPVSPRLLRAIGWLERRTYATADAVMCTNESYRRIACARTGRSPAEVAIVRSGPDPERMRRGAPAPGLRDGHRHLVCYLGIMGPQDGVDTVIRTAAVVVRDLGRTDIRFAVLGYGDELAGLRRLVDELGLSDHVCFTGRVDLPEITEWLSTAALGLSPDPWTPFNDVSTMNKTLEYLAYELPVIAFSLTETVVSAGEAAVYVAPTGDATEDVRAYARAVVGLVDDPARRAVMGRAGRDRIEQFLGWPASSRRYLEVYAGLLGDRLVTEARGHQDHSMLREGA